MAVNPVFGLSPVTFVRAQMLLKKTFYILLISSFEKAL